MTNNKPNAGVRADFPDDHGFKSIMLAYRRHLRARGLSDGTVVQRILHIETLRAVHADVLAVETADLEAILSQRRHTHAPESRRSMRSSWQAFYRWAVSADLIDDDPAEPLAPIRLPRVVARIADDDQIRAALRTCTAEEAAMILLGRGAGLRLSEIATLHISSREGDVLRIVGKGGHTRMIPLNGELIDALDRVERLQARTGYYFPGRWGGHIHPQSLEKIIKRVSGWNPHALRHAAATAAYEATHDLRAVQELLGHSSLATTERYIHVRADQIRTAVEATQLGI